MRCSTSTVTRRIVSCVFRRSLLSAGSKLVASACVIGAACFTLIGPLIDEPPDARQEAPAAFEAGITPLDLFFGRRHEHDVQAQRIGAEFLHHVVRIDDVALRLRHDGAVLQHHTLSQQVAEWLVMLDHAEIAEYPREEPRIDQVQDRVLDAADCRNPTGIQYLALAGSNASLSFFGSQKR